MQTMQFVGEELEESCCYGSCDEMVQAAAVVGSSSSSSSSNSSSSSSSSDGACGSKKIFRIKKINQDQKNI